MLRGPGPKVDEVDFVEIEEALRWLIGNRRERRARRRTLSLVVATPGWGQFWKRGPGLYLLLIIFYVGSRFTFGRNTPCGVLEITKNTAQRSWTSDGRWVWRDDCRTHGWWLALKHHRGSIIANFLAVISGCKKFALGFLFLASSTDFTSLHRGAVSQMAQRAMRIQKMIVCNLFTRDFGAYSGSVFPIHSDFSQKYANSLLLESQKNLETLDEYSLLPRPLKIYLPAIWTGFSCFGSEWITAKIDVCPPWLLVYPLIRTFCSVAAPAWTAGGPSATAMGWDMDRNAGDTKPFTEWTTARIRTLQGDFRFFLHWNCNNDMEKTVELPKDVVTSESNSSTAARRAVLLHTRCTQKRMSSYCIWM